MVPEYSHIRTPHKTVTLATTNKQNYNLQRLLLDSSKNIIGNQCNL